MHFLQRPDPTGEECPACGLSNTMFTNRSYTFPMEKGVLYCTDEIICDKCNFSFHVAWLTNQENTYYVEVTNFDLD